MGTIKHNSIVVTHWDKELLVKAHSIALEIFKKKFGEHCSLVSNVCEGVVNSGGSFFIGADMSKEGWPQSDDGDAARKEFLDWMSKECYYCDYLELVYGGDSDYCAITRDKDSDLNKDEY